MSKRKAMLYGRSLLNKKAKQFTPWNGSRLSPEEEQISDAMSAIEYVRKLFLQQKLGDRFPPMIFKHQIYSLVENRTEVDKEVSSLAESGKVKVFQLEHRDEEYVIILTSDFILHLQKFHEMEPNGTSSKCHDGDKNLVLSPNQLLISRFLVEVVSVVSDLCISEHTIMKQYGFKDKDITALVDAGLLTLRDAGSWWFSVPGAGWFVKLFNKGRQAALRMIRATKYKEILMTELKSRKSPASMKLGILYHVHDLVGSDLVKCVSSSSGLLLRIIAN